MARFTVDKQKLIHPCWCGGAKFSSVFLGSFRTCKVVACDHCGQLRTYPEPALEQLAKIYSGETGKYSVASNDAEKDRLFSHFGQEALSIIEKHAQGKGKLIDVGCNLGHTLKVARARGWEVAGLEINTDVQPYLRECGYTLYDTYLEENTVPESHFDVLIANQVLEHVPNPVAFLQAARRVVRPGGLIFLSLPCFWGPIPLLLKRDRWYAFVPEEHIWQFSEGNLKKLVASQGFDVVHYHRGCSDLAGKLSANPKSWLRYLVFRFPVWFGMGDFNNILLVNKK